jgi:type IV secretory pathway TrbD component
MERGATNSQSDKSLAELTKQLSDQTTALGSKEVELAKAELALKGQRLGLGAGMFGGAGRMVAHAFGALTACLILALATTLDAWLAALIVAAAYGGCGSGDPRVFRTLGAGSATQRLVQV